jgi:hypothetical protein
MNTAVAHYYRQFRKANPSYTALAAYNSARAHIFFRARLSADVAAFKKRSAAAKKAWKARKAAA